MSSSFENPYISLRCNLRSDGYLFIEGHLKTHLPTESSPVLYAANPIQRMTNYSGSALPYPTAEVAFERTPNKYTIEDYHFSTVFIYPNSYYIMDTMVPPTLFFEYEDQLFTFALPNPFPLRTLSYRSELNGPEAFNRRQELGVQTQEQLFKALTEPQPYLY